MAGLEAIATERLRGERLRPRHVDVLLSIFADPRVAETIGGVSDRERSFELAGRRLRFTDVNAPPDGRHVWERTWIKTR